MGPRLWTKFGKNWRKFGKCAHLKFGNVHLKFDKTEPKLDQTWKLYVSRVGEVNCECGMSVVDKHEKLQL
jgi:hypothetical protein